MYFTISQIERGIFKRVELKAIALGHWVDETVLSSAEDLQNALSGILLPIEVIGIGDYVARGEKPRNAIIVDFENGAIGEVGAMGRFFYESIDVKFRKYAHATQSENLRFVIRIIAENTDTRRVAEKILKTALPQKSYVLGVNQDLSSTAYGFWVLGSGFTDVSKGGVYGIERVYAYQVNNVFLEVPTYIGEVAKLTEFDFNIENSK